jgi:hypothetical protein
MIVRYGKKEAILNLVYFFSMTSRKAALIRSFEGIDDAP